MTTNRRTIPTAFQYDSLRSHLIKCLIAKFKFDVGFTFGFYNSITCFKNNILNGMYLYSYA